MTTMTVKLDKKQAAKIARWARSRRATKSDIIRDLIERAGPVETGDDLADWVAGRPLGLLVSDRLGAGDPAAGTRPGASLSAPAARAQTGGLDHQRGRTAGGRGGRGRDFGGFAAFHHSGPAPRASAALRAAAKTLDPTPGRKRRLAGGDRRRPRSRNRRRRPRGLRTPGREVSSLPRHRLIRPRGSPFHLRDRRVVHAGRVDAPARHAW
jgi:predicted transcriptional regulator